jgi:hypothetical protein
MKIDPHGRLFVLPVSLHLLSGAVMAALSAGCVATPSPVVRLHPDSANPVWVAGRAVVGREVEGVRVAIAFDHVTDDHMGMRVEVQNNTAKRWDVDPTHMRCVYCETEKNCSRRWAVADPETRLLELDQARSSQIAQATNDAALGATFLLLSALGDVASIASGKANRSTGATTAAIAHNMEADAARAERNLDRIDLTRRSWETSTLRRTTLFPGQAVAGYVYLRTIPKAEKVWFSIWADGRELWFPFRQTTHWPND